VANLALSNAFSTTLSAAITTTDGTSISVASATGAPASGDFVIIIDSERMLVTAGHGTTTWTVTRGYDGSTAATHLNGATVTDHVCAGGLDRWRLEYMAIGTCEGRISLTTGVPVTTSDVTGAGTIRFVPFGGNRIALYTGSEWKMYTFTELSLALTLTDAKNYDVFIYDNSGTLTLELSAAWTNDTTRADALVLQDGIYVKSGAATRRYLGTIRASGTNTTEDSAVKRFVWNFNNQASRSLQKTEATAIWTYSTGTWRQANNAAANKVEVVVGLAGIGEVEISLHARAQGTAHQYISGITRDATTAPTVWAINYSAATSARYYHNTTTYRDWPIGYHYYAWMEYASDGTATVISNGESGLRGYVWG
jgi:hypothetical protein